MSNSMLDETRITLTDAMRCFATSVCIISTSDEESNHYAMTATAVCSVSLEPESMLVCVNKDTLFNSVIEKTDIFCVNLLTVDQASQSNACAGGLPQDNRVNHDEWEILENGLAILKHAQANILCRKGELFSYGTHNILIGNVYRILINKDINPLLYMDGKYGRFEETS